ncbi:MAG: TIGR04551 family protein [Myxococcota bacterium]
MKRTWTVSGALAVALLLASTARAEFDETGDEIRAETETTVNLHGYFRTRFELLHNLDLDRGPTPSGQLLFPVPLSDPNAQNLTHADLRLRTDIALIVPAASMALHVRLDALDNLALGSQPDGVPSVTTSQRAADQPFVIRRAYAQVLTPFGLLAAGRMGNDWGLGMLANGGDCPSCDSGDAADRIAFFTPLLGHVFTLAYDFSAIGPFAARSAPGRVVNLDRADDVRTFTFALLNFRTDLARRRRARAGLVTFEYGAYLSHRWQDQDVPADYLPVAQPIPIDSAQVVERDFRATAVDLWMRLTLPTGRIELEAAYIGARIGQPSLLPGVRLRDEFTSRQFGFAFQSEFGPGHATESGAYALGFDGGYASGDSAPGFGALLGGRNGGPNQPAPVAGDIDGPQAVSPFDTTVNNFRFHPDYRVDRILFREILGTITDAFYLRPHGRVRLAQIGPGRLELRLAAIASFAASPSSTPSGERALGLELDPTLAYAANGFVASLEYAALFPFAAFDSPTLDARTAQLFRFRLSFNY